MAVAVNITLKNDKIMSKENVTCKVNSVHRVLWRIFCNSTAVHTKMGHVSKTTPLLWMICLPYGKT